MTAGQVDSPGAEQGHRIDNISFDKFAPDIRRDLRNLCRLDNHHGPTAILFEYALVAAMVLLCLRVSWWCYPLAVLVIGSTQRFLAHFLHESSHKTLARHPLVNLVSGSVFAGYLVFHLYGPYRSSHVGQHHRLLGDPDGDPDYRFHIECGLYDPQRWTRAFLVREILQSALGLRTVDYLRYLIRERLMAGDRDLTVSSPVSVRTERRVLVVQWALIVAGCAWFGVLPELALFWFVPLVTSNVAVGWLSELAEHYPLPESEHKRVLLTRNRHGRLVERFLLSRHNDRYHLVHHLNSGIPFWNLGRAHRALLRDPGYLLWDGIWAGVLTTPRSRAGAETVISYATKYRNWRLNGGDPADRDHTFARLMMIRAADVPAAPSTSGSR